MRMDWPRERRYCICIERIKLFRRMHIDKKGKISSVGVYNRAPVCDILTGFAPVLLELASSSL
jgi:hypothetical protein